MASTAKRTLFRRYSGNLSLFLSSLCLLHCLAMPIVLLLIPALSHILPPEFELVLILAMLPISLFGFVPTWIKHKDTRLGLMFVSGLTLILVSQFGMAHGHEHTATDLAANQVHMASFLAQTGIMLIGVMLLAWSVYRNNKHTHVCSNPHHHH
jgi:hypothetical membrane protein